jgi:AcrR family transcriptional regulator
MRIRNAVMDAVMEMLEERGIEGFNVAEIAAKVGIPESTIYRRWGNRDGLLIDTVMTRMGETIPLPDTGNFRSDLHEFLQQSAVFLESPTGRLLARPMFSAMNHADALVRQTYWTTRFKHTGLMIQRAIERGEVAPETSPEVFLTMLTGAFYVRILVLNAPLDQPFLDQIEHIMLQGVEKSDHSSSPSSLPG